MCWLKLWVWGTAMHTVFAYGREPGMKATCYELVDSRHVKLHQRDWHAACREHPRLRWQGKASHLCLAMMRRLGPEPSQVLLRLSSAVSPRTVIKLNFGLGKSTPVSQDIQTGPNPILRAPWFRRPLTALARSECEALRPRRQRRWLCRASHKARLTWACRWRRTELGVWSCASLVPFAWMLGL